MLGFFTARDELWYKNGGILKIPAKKVLTHPPDSI